MSSFHVHSNVPALNAARLLSINTGHVARSLERLSSGLRINRAADDPAGLSISEKLRAQTRGLSRAAANALDGVSLLQTADSGLTEVASLLQSIRELAVSAADGTKTAADRAAIQEEVAQYIAEIDRIAGATEFNTKTLLDGSLGALISTSDFSRLQASVTGDVGAGGGFLIQPRVKSAGVLERQLSDVFTVTGTGDLAGPISGLGGLRASAVLVTDDGTGTGNTGLYRADLPNTANGSVALAGYLSAGTNAALSVTASTAAPINAAGVSFAGIFEAEEVSAGDYVRFTFNNVSVVTLSLAVSAATDINTWTDTTLNNAMSGAGLGTARGTATGMVSLSLAGTVSLTAVTFVDVDNSGSDFALSFAGSTGTIQSSPLHNAISVTFSNNAASWSGSLTKSGANDSVLSIGDANTGAIHVRFDPATDFSAGGVVGEIDLLRFSSTGGVNNLQQYGYTSFVGSGVASGTYLVSATGARTFAIYGFDNERYTSLVGAGTDQDTALLAARGARFHVDGAPASSTFSVGATVIGENLDDGSGTNPLTGTRLMFDGAVLQSGERAVFEVGASNVVRAGRSTTLASIGAMQAAGVFSGATTQTFDLYLNGEPGKATVVVTSTDTLEDLAGKISLALWQPNGGGLLGESGIARESAPPRLVRVNEVGTARGTLSIAVPRPGAELVVAGNDDLVDAMNFAVNVVGQAPTFSVSAFNAVTGQVVGTAEVGTDEVVGLIPGLTLYFDNSVNLTLDPEPPVGGANTNEQWPYPAPDETPALSITGSAAADDFYLHVAPNPLVMQVGASTGQVLSMWIPDVGARALGVLGLNVATQEQAGAAIGTVDRALARASTAQSRVGAYQNRLESTIRELDVAAENTLAAESRIRDLDYATEIIALTRAQVLAAAASFALTQANLQAQAVLPLLAA